MCCCNLLTVAHDKIIYFFESCSWHTLPPFCWPSSDGVEIGSFLPVKGIHLYIAFPWHIILPFRISFAVQAVKMWSLSYFRPLCFFSCCWVAIIFFIQYLGVDRTGLNSLPRGIIEERSDLDLKPLWSSSKSKVLFEIEMQ